MFKRKLPNPEGEPLSAERLSESCGDAAEVIFLGLYPDAEVTSGMDSALRAAALEVEIAKTNTRLTGTEMRTINGVASFELHFRRTRTDEQPGTTFAMYLSHSGFMIMACIEGGRGGTGVLDVRKKHDEISVNIQNPYKESVENPALQDSGFVPGFSLPHVGEARLQAEELMRVLQDIGRVDVANLARD